MPIFMLISDILCVCILLIFRLCFITTMFMREGDHVKPWSPLQFLIIRSSLVTFALFYFQFFKPENHQKLCSYFVYFGFVNLRAIGAWQPPQLAGDAKLFVCYCRLFEERGKGTNLRLSQKIDNYPESPLRGKLFLLHHSTLGAPTSIF
jgi:hypothetical protein